MDNEGVASESHAERMGGVSAHPADMLDQGRPCFPPKKREKNRKSDGLCYVHSHVSALCLLYHIIRSPNDHPALTARHRNLDQTGEDHDLQALYFSLTHKEHDGLCP